MQRRRRRRIRAPRPARGWKEGAAILESLCNRSMPDGLADAMEMIELFRLHVPKLLVAWRVGEAAWQEACEMLEGFNCEGESEVPWGTGPGDAEASSEADAT